MTATREMIGEILASESFDDSDKWVVKWQFGYLGDFQRLLSSAIKQADENNLAKLALGFPVEVEGFIRWNRRDLAERLRAAGLDI